MAELLLQFGALVNAADDQAITPLMEAARKSQVIVSEVLLTNGAVINAVSLSGNTALHLACMWGAADCVALLISKGADVDVANKHSVTALAACITENAEAKDRVTKAYNQVTIFPP